MTSASDTVLDEKLSRNKSVTEPWITSPRNDDNKTEGSVNNTTEDTKNGKTALKETTEKPSNSTNNEDETSQSVSETANNESGKNEHSNNDIKEPSLVQEKAEQQSHESNNVTSETKEIKPAIIGNVIVNKSAKSNGIVDFEPITDDDLDMYDPELLITEEEKKAFEYMIEQKKEKIEKDKAQFETWVDSITRRRMFALSRLRKLGKCHGERFQFYGKVQEYVKEVESVLSSVSSSTKVHSGNRITTAQSSKPPSSTSSPTTTKQASRHVPQTESLQRETTGFVNVPETDQKSDSISSNSMDNNSFTNDESPKIVPVQS
ncbi:putative uncharacterized protein DDB_G0291608 [Ylistrum balloti]|uniref:putative uncharacterized protein DDB_G0291608 n=1 Tax=Ylistrum balloti TaxID=509963 RepID=UPI002905822E|nr:putative uncharacterized protein DDB_G0291608 [Ylistrum balloti]